MRGLSKSFGRVQALRHVDLALRPGEVHALLGENGAGKSTLMHLLYGLFPPDEGELLLDGRAIPLRSPREAREAGIGMVHQHFTLTPKLTVAENLALGQRSVFYRAREAEGRVSALCQRVGFDVDPCSPVERLSVGQQQRVEILKALSLPTRLLILDEPTAVLAPQEIDGLLALMRRLADEGIAVVFITHKLAEVERIADRITVLRRGERVLSGQALEFSASAIAQAMIGTDSPSDYANGETDSLPEPRPVLLSVNSLSVRDETGRSRVEDVSFEIRAGEVLGIAGVEGNGQAELAEAITGLLPHASGEIVLQDGVTDSTFPVKSRPVDFLDAGGAHIPEDRRHTGLALEMPIWENLILESHRRPPIRRGIRLDLRRARQESRTLVREYEVRASSVESMAGTLSGGNQQKLVIAREMDRKPRLLVAVNPTRGLDVRSTAYVAQKIREHRAGGGATLLISSELDELYALSDRIAVMHDGRIVAIVPPTTSREEVGLWMTRGSLDDAPRAALETGGAAVG